MKKLHFLMPLVLIFCLVLSGCASNSESSSPFSMEALPAFDGQAYAVLNDNVPDFHPDDFSEVSFESYSELDSLGRCGPAAANIGPDVMPTEERGSIGSVKPTGWHTVKYDCVDGKYLYNRCHLIGYQLTAENANVKNLITGTRFLNVEGMLPFENMVADYIKETGNHVLYRVTPVFEGDHLLASGVRMEAMSVEDAGEGICFHVYVFNVQPGVVIDYATGESRLASEESGGGSSQEKGASSDTADAVYILNVKSRKFHRPSCAGVKGMSQENKETYQGDRSILIDQGYSPCGNCCP